MTENKTMLGYQNKVLRIDLTKKGVSFEPLRMDFARKYVGSKGLAIRYMYEELDPGIDPLGPENKLFLTTGPLTGTPVPCSGKLSVAAKSPATGTMNDCSIGGHVGIKLKFAGYDMVIFEGKLDKPGYVLIEDGKIRFMDASDLWGLGSHEAEDILSKKYGTDYSIMSIGPAGENLNIMACINSDYYRQAGRGGIGAVMGSKNMKAIVIRGTGGVKVNDIENTTKRIVELLRENVVTEDNDFIFHDGTTAFLEACNDGGILPWKNFSDTTDEKWTEYNGDVLKKYRVGKRGCGSCGLGCGNFLKIGDAICEGPEYESISVAGPNAGIRDPEKIVKFNEVADNMGLDTISAGDTIIWAMEMTEKGIHDFGIKFGEADKMIHYLELIAKNEGVGADLALGTKRASEKFGGTEFAMQVKGLEYPQYEPRGSWAMSVSYAVSDRGACHMRSYAPNLEVFEAAAPPYTGENKGQLVYDLAEFNAIKFSLCICDFWGSITYEIMAELLTMVTGVEWTVEDMSKIGRRVINIGRAFNQREGFDRKNDTVPKRVVTEALQNGPAKGQVIPQEVFDDMLSQYYDVMGWDENGMMPEELIASLL
ncbi:aldehyde ferredoxin oxidoreductase family protein [Anaerovorax odorimutans]|uniref:Aldehyde ferredoxin oxidoreductase family protein n=1 Tax=Anaerovorax odorimutans TaxID=109327 RepID=A0ABT1RK68_9FIRM|nr:aldehyde ferredoxin oxidoreductase family protein [Anaerovorax odorimutans]MCQ4635586.1 aldehyde ferredoxin oxidoreductase family protein [Anaerovorax odorimutans]